MIGLGYLGWMVHQNMNMIFDLAMELNFLKLEILDLTREIRAQRKLLTVYSESTSEHALMSHVMTMMRSNRVSIDQIMDPEI